MVNRIEITPTTKEEENWSEEISSADVGGGFFLQLGSDFESLSLARNLLNSLPITFFVRVKSTKISVFGHPFLD